MDSQPVKDIEAALRDMEALAKEGSGKSEAPKPSAKQDRPSRKQDKPQKMESKRPKKRVNPITWLFRTVFSLVILVILPFILLIRLTVYLYTAEALNIWLALGASIGATTLLLLIYGAIVQKRFTGTWNISKRKIQFFLVVVLLYSGYSLMYISGSNVKSGEVSSAYLSLHPTLRLATSTLVLIDQDLIVTDMGRTPQDYIKMGLPIRENSLHYKQDSGFVEAVDIRTKGKPEWVNMLVSLYYKSMGFNTLRHVGTADHLHISVPR
ncbi:MAG: hypothetical protein KTR29_17325 [Rhodothermaceae bacterium]|nr:hypothetical protein [Rhodothermaceae bacterium]